eukprot:CAMPEP_0170622668 /NCGR_PEP_ID=MMETSP0224-20130122/29260_1 /TAXON_ID=285029 /ORGANISM="Togula jolla, Strain CCCM 725" /LENGTH=238 /DNA_ID=CAMNT_0010949015 /DNA_START=11 /DNA_END=724 /DNA_ORIENTATION=-
MAAKAGPIVITLKKRLGPTKLGAGDDGADRSGAAGRSGSPTAAAAPLAPSGARSCSRSRARSPLRSPSPLSLRGAGTPAIARSAVLNAGALEDIFARFHGELDSWLQAESAKLERAEASGIAARESLRSSAEQVSDFLRDHAPGTRSHLGPDPTGEAFAGGALPQFLELMEQDSRVLKEVTGLLASHAERRLKTEDLETLKSNASPLPLMKALLRNLLSNPKGAAAAAPREKRRRRER